MNKLNVFNNPYYRWCHPNCWLKNLRMFFRSFKYAYQRITRGWADCDTFDLDSYYLTIFSDTLNYLANNHVSYPGNNNFPDDETWTNYLKDMVQKFYRSKESNEFYPTPEADKWWKWEKEHPNNIFWDKKESGCSQMVKKEENPYSKAMIKESNENAEKRYKDFAEAWSMMGDVFFDLWD